MNDIKICLPARATASHTRLGALYAMTGLVGPYDCVNLLNADLACTWNAGRFAPVSLQLDLGEPKRVVGLLLTPCMKPRRGAVRLAVWTDNGVATPHSATWEDMRPASIMWADAVHTRFITLDFLDSPSWIALRCVEIAEACHEPVELLP